jgi:hypothetical protein
MRAVAGYVLGAVLTALFGGVCLTAGLLDRDLVLAEQDLVASKYEVPEATLERAERLYTYSSRLPWVGDDELNDVRARRAALQYWQGRYSSIISDLDESGGGVAEDNIALQLITANAVFRTGQATAKDKQSTIEALDGGINAYLSVLKNATRSEDAAHNYEYLVRLREEILRGRRLPKLADVEDPAGRHGRAGVATEADDREFKIYVPLEEGERDTTGSKPGQAAPIRRQG